MKVFLGGTVNGSMWRSYVIPKLDVDYFDPVVDDWKEENLEREIYERMNSSYVLYVLTPKMTGFYAIAEVTDDSYHRPDRTLFCYLETDDGLEFNDEQLQSMEKLAKKVRENGALYFEDLDEVVGFLNSAKDISLSDNSNESPYDTFISFGRMDSQNLCTRIFNDLSHLNFEVCLDQNPVPLDVDNPDQVHRNIRLSHNFIFVVSPHAVRSEYCKRQLDYAIELGKNIIVIVYLETGTDWQTLNPRLKDIHWISFNESGEHFDNFISQLKKKIDIHSEVKKIHTSITLKAFEWKSKERDQQLLLNGNERKEAVQWLSKVATNESSSCEVSILQKEFIEESRKLQFIVRLIFMINKRLSFFLNKKWFDKIVAIIALGNPIALIPQLVSIIANKKATGVSIPMWCLFVVLQLSFTLLGIKQKDTGLFTSMFLSTLISLSVIILTLVYS